MQHYECQAEFVENTYILEDLQSSVRTKFTSNDVL